VRFTLLLASSALAASLVLSGCSTGGSQAIPGGTQTAMSHHAGTPQLVVVGAKHDTSCPSDYFVCAETSKSSPAEVGICISDSSPPSCSSLAPGTWSWTAESVKVKKGAPTSKKTKKINGTWSPNPGNPSTLTVTTKSKKSSKGKVKYAVYITACNSVSSCAAGYVGITID
jgi:hypothetical protein